MLNLDTCWFSAALANLQCTPANNTTKPRTGFSAFPCILLLNVINDCCVKSQLEDSSAQNRPA